MQRYLNALVDAGHDVLNTVGIRRAESMARSKMNEWEWSEGFDCEVWRPILLWSEQDVIDIHTRHGLRPNPLYLRGASRVGCWPCVFSRKDEIRLVADTDPERIDLIRELESDLQSAMAERAAARGETVRNPPTWFQGQGRDAKAGGPRGEQVGVPIDEMVKWSRTLRGGTEQDRQIELLPAADEGCMRWGLCETSDPDGDEK